ncbi:MAG: hypothetical protein K8T25_12985, partial [Planctomycetia bacterium]|nr:hypothetical protein [Planctomycetia bacterium]
VDTEGGGGVPSDFTERHLVRKADFVAVWSRHGIVVAAKPSAAARLAATRRLFEELPSLAADVEALIHCSPTDEGVLDKGEMLVRRVAQVKHGLAQPEGNLVRRFFEAIRLDEVLSTLSDIDSAVVGRRQAAADSQRLVEQKDLAAKMDANLGRVAMIQTVVHLIEYIVAVTYCVELWHAFVQGNEHYEHAKLHVGEWLHEHFQFLNWNNWLHVFTYFHWDLLLPAGIGFGLVMLVNYGVEGHWVEWHWLKRRLGFGRKRADKAGHGEASTEY